MRHYILAFAVLNSLSFPAWAVGFDAAKSTLQAKLCQETTANACFKVVQCQLPGGGSLVGYLDAQTGAVFNMKAAARHYISPAVLVDEFQAEYQAAVQTPRIHPQAAAGGLTSKKMQSQETDHLSVRMHRAGRLAQTRVAIKNAMPACVQPGDIK